MTPLSNANERDYEKIYIGNEEKKNSRTKESL